ncbi:hypothetical protein BC833DRAFT_657010 [Globomyces pollinis-pini]|nr:hypothetical protein BC833DRAFT_657010 [Globomyces pollinis-pini]
MDRMQSIYDTDAKITIVVMYSIFILLVIAYLGVEVLEYCHQMGMLSKEWEEHYQYISWKPVNTIKEKPSVTNALISAVGEAIEDVSKVAAKLQPVQKIEEERSSQLILKALTAAVTAKENGSKPGMYFKKGCKPVPNPVDGLPYILQIPFRVSDRVWDDAVNLTAAAINSCVITPIQFSFSSYSRFHGYWHGTDKAKAKSSNWY